MEKIRNLSIRKTIIVYMGIAIILSYLLSMACMWGIGRVQQDLWRKYAGQEAGHAGTASSGTVPAGDLQSEPAQDRLSEPTQDLRSEPAQDLLGEPATDLQRRVGRIPSEKMSRRDAFVSEVCDFLDTWCILIITMAACISGVFLFYETKIKKPLELLEYGSRKIAGQDLDFQITYGKQDEMGRLCAEFEHMRSALAVNNKNMWRMLEQERLLRSAIAHDIRSPLAVLRGYQEMLKVFIPMDRLDKAKVMEILDSCLRQVDRLDGFVESMKLLSRVDGREIRDSSTSLKQLLPQLKADAAFLKKSENPSCEVIFKTGPAKPYKTDPMEPYGACMSAKAHGSPMAVEAYDSPMSAEAHDSPMAAESYDSPMLVDVDMVCEIYENLLTNALRFAQRRILVQVENADGFLNIYIQDDGCGFQGDLEQVTRAYYHENPAKDNSHFGLGLYISRIYCEKHGGGLQIGNVASGGAYVKARLKIY